MYSESARTVLLLLKMQDVFVWSRIRLLATGSQTFRKGLVAVRPRASRNVDDLVVNNKGEALRIERMMSVLKERLGGHGPRRMMRNNAGGWVSFALQGVLRDLL
jgi:hypothetical protein